MPVVITSCKVTVGGTSMTNSFTICKHLTKDLAIGLDIQLIYKQAIAGPQKVSCNFTGDAMSLLIPLM